MCDKCGKTAEMIREAVNFGGTGTFKWVEFTIPGGEPVMYTSTYDKDNTST